MPAERSKEPDSLGTPGGWSWKGDLETTLTEFTAGSAVLHRHAAGRGRPTDDVGGGGRRVEEASWPARSYENSEPEG